jgi:hypothetical protein
MFVGVAEYEKRFFLAKNQIEKDLLREEYKKYFDSEKEKFNSKLRTKDIMMANYIKEQDLKNKELVEKNNEKEKNTKVVICTAEYAPVCAIDESGEKKTYGNKCQAGKNKIISNNSCEEKLENKAIKVPVINISEGQVVSGPLKIYGNSGLS